MTLRDIILNDFQAIEKDLGNLTFTWQGDDYVCAVGIADNAKELDKGGFSMGSDLIITVRLDLFNDIFPEAQQELTFDNALYRIDKVGTHPNRPLLTLYCNSPYKGT